MRGIHFKHRPLTILLAAGLLGQCNITAAATATATAEITAGGTEQAWEARSYRAPLDYIQRFEGAHIKSLDKTYPIPAAFSACQLDGSLGNKLPGLSIHPIKIVSPGYTGGKAYENYVLYSSPSQSHLQINVSVRGLKGKGAEYYADYEFHFKCPKTVAWTRTHSQSITVDSKNGYSSIGNYTGPVGSNDGIAGTAQLDNNLFKVEIKNPTPADAVITGGMFLTSPSNGQKGPNLFALYEPTNVTASTVKVLPSQAITNQGGGSAIADINNNGIDDIIFVSYQDVVNSDGRNQYTYQIGWDIDSEGNPKSWTPLKYVDGTGWEGNGASVALFKPTTAGAATKAIFVNHDQGSQAVNDLRMRSGIIDGNGNFHESTNFAVPSFGASIYGMGAELYDIDNNDHPEIIIAGNGTGNTLPGYKIGWNLQDNGTVTKWSPTIPTLIYNSVAVAPALANLDRNPRPEIILVYREGSGNAIHQVTGWNLNQSGEPMHWGYPTKLSTTLPLGLKQLDLSIMDLDVFGQTTQRGSGHREKTWVISALDNDPAGADNFHYQFIRHSNTKDGVFNGNFTNAQKWHRWGPSTYDAQGAICSTGGNQYTNAWDVGMYSDEPIAIEAGKPYSITFDAWSPAGETSKVMGAKLGSATVNTTIYRQNLSIALKPGWNRYQLTYNATATNPNARLEFFFGSSAAPSKLCIDNVRFSPSLNTTNDFASFPGNSATNLIKNGNFNFGSMAGWINKSDNDSGASEIATTKIKNGELCHFTPGNTRHEHESLGQNNLNLQQGAKYRLAYDIRGQYSSPVNNAKPKVTIKLGGDADLPGFDNYWTESDIEVQKEKTSRFFDFTMDSITDPLAGLAIFTGDTYSSEICIDNVSLTKL